MSRSNYKYYYNIIYLEVNRPNGGVKLEPNGFWSRAVPVRNDGYQEHLQEDVLVREAEAPPVEEKLLLLKRSSFCSTYALFNRRYFRFETEG